MQIVDYNIEQVDTESLDIFFKISENMKKTYVRNIIIKEMILQKKKFFVIILILLKGSSY